MHVSSRIASWTDPETWAFISLILTLLVVWKQLQTDADFMTYFLKEKPRLFGIFTLWMGVLAGVMLTYRPVASFLLREKKIEHQIGWIMLPTVFSTLSLIATISGPYAIKLIPTRRDGRATPLQWAIVILICMGGLGLEIAFDQYLMALGYRSVSPREGWVRPEDL